MTGLFASGRIVDLILGLVAFEAMCIVAHRRFSGGESAPPPLFSNLLSGVFLLLGVRGALVGVWWGWIGLCLLAALLAHVSDLRSRWGNAKTIPK